MKTLLIGYGNSTRSDDGVGIEVAEAIGRLNLSHVETRTSQQLHVDLLEDFHDFQRIYLVDVALASKEVEIVRVNTQASGMTSSHHLSADLLLVLARAIGYKIPEIYVCRIPGEDFSFGNKLSALARAGAADAQKKLTRLLEASEALHARG